jgi:hypothetical protein
VIAIGYKIEIKTKKDGPLLAAIKMKSTSINILVAKDEKNKLIRFCI